jgi:HlyD family secretion protein
MDTPNRKRRIVLIVAGTGVAATLAYALLSRSRSADELALYGNVDIREVNLGFRVSGRLAALAVDEGDTVHAGDVLARLDPTPIELELNEARANAGAIAARVALLRSGYRPEEVAQARAAVAERRAAFVNAEQGLGRQQQLKGTGAVAERLYDDAVAARDEARARLKAAEESFAQLQRGYRRQEIAEAEANGARAAAAAAQAEQHLADAVLRAPADGVILTRAVEPGTILAAGGAVFTESLLAPVWARVYVNEPDLGRVPPGRAVLVYTDSNPDKPYHGRIGFVSPTAEFTPKNVETPELRTALVYRVRVVVGDADRALRQGMPVTVHLESTAPARPR